jgi:PAS domain S-box-containing protein
VIDTSADKAAILEGYRDAFNRHDVDAWVELFHPDVVMVPTANWTPPGTSYRGQAGMRSYAHEIFGRLPYLRAERSEELRDLGDRLLARVKMVAGPDKASATAQTIIVLYTFKDGQIFRAEGFATEEEAIEAARRESGDQFRQLFQHASDAVVLSDDEGLVIDANPAACSLYGLTLDELSGRVMLEFAPPERVGDLDELWKGLRAGTQVTGESEIVSANGTRHAVELRARPGFFPGRHLVILTRGGEGSESPESQRVASPRLTEREREVFRLLALGFSGSEVAERLVLSPHTVRRHVEKGIARLEAKNRVQATAIALSRGEIRL